MSRAASGSETNSIVPSPAARSSLILLIVPFILLVAWGCNPKEKTKPRTLENGPAVVKRVVDGDTVILVQTVQTETGTRKVEDRVRLLGVNTPETVHPKRPIEPWGPEAAEFTKNFLREKAVRIELGPKYRDKYDRVLAFVYVGDLMLNEELARSGLAEVKIYPGEDCEQTARIVVAGDQAQAAAIGIWSGKPPEPVAPRDPLVPATTPD